MCVSLGSIPSYLISPIGLIKDASKAMGVEHKLITGIAEWTDPASIIADKAYKKEQKQAQSAEQANQDAWNRHYASKQTKPASPFTNRTTGGENS